MQRTRVQSLVREDATCYGPLSLGAQTAEAGLPRLDLQLRQPTLHKRSRSGEKLMHHNQRKPAAAKNQSTNIKDLQTWVPTYKPLYKICFSTNAI